MAMISERASVVTQFSAVETAHPVRQAKSKTAKKIAAALLTETEAAQSNTLFCLPTPAKRVFSESDLNLGLLQNSAILDMMRNPPQDESGFGI